MLIESFVVKVTDIPSIMVANGWTTGANLMNHWFSRSATAPKNIEDSFVTMDSPVYLEFKR